MTEPLAEKMLRLEKEDAIRQFQKDARILLNTDAGSESCDASSSQSLFQLGLRYINRLFHISEVPDVNLVPMLIGAL